MKDVYLTLSINSGVFPFVGMQDFARFCKNVKIVDGVITVSRLDFIVTGVKARPKGLDTPKLSGQMPTDLNRAEFLEALVRVALCKYKD